MKDEKKTKEQLVQELMLLRARIAELEQGILENEWFDDEILQSAILPGKPIIPRKIQTRWQRIVDLMVEIIKVPVGLIMRVEQPQLEVFVSSSYECNPYKKGEKTNINTGIYCEAVILQRSLLFVPNALKDPNWANNPDIEMGMVSYLGYPLQWPDSDIFGTICVKDNKSNQFSALDKKLMAELKEVIEGDLRFIIQINKKAQIDIKDHSILKSNI